MLPFVREKRHLSLIPLPFPAGFHLNHDSCGHTLLVSSERRGPVCVHMCVRPVRDYSPKEGRHYWTYLDLFGKGMRGTYVKRVEKEKRQWNLSVRSDLMGGMMNLEVLLWSAREGDDSSFLLFSCSSVFVKSRADDIYQREDSWSYVSKVNHEKLEQRTRGGEKIELALKVSDPTISYICFCNITASLLNLLLRGFRCLKHFSEARRICVFFEELTNELLDNFYLNW